MAPELNTLGELYGIDGQTVVVTGGGGVLGSVMAKGLAKAGGKLVILSRREESCGPVAEAIRNDGGDAIAVPCDVTNVDSLNDAVAKVAEAYGPVDILINAAGGNNPKATTTPDLSFFDLDPDAVMDVFKLNFQGTLLACRAFGKSMADRGRGSILNVSSMAADRPLTRVVTYSAAKAAIDNFTKWLSVHMAKEYHPSIRVNAIAPGFFLTAQNRFLLTDKETGELTARGKSIITATPAGRFGEAGELVSATLFLSGPGAAFVTGIVLPVDGGFSAFSGV